MTRFGSMLVKILVSIWLSIFLASCGQTPGQDLQLFRDRKINRLNRLFKSFCKQKNTNCSFTYQGSLDIGLSLRPGRELVADAVWPSL